MKMCLPPKYQNSQAGRCCKIFLMLVMLLHLAGELLAQEPVLRNFSIKEGLASNETYFIYQDSKSHIWICTDAGLVKYDANTFRTFNVSNGMPDNTVFELFEDKKNRIWFRTFAGPIGYIENDKVYTLGASEAIIDFQRKGMVCSFAMDEHDNLYLGRQAYDTAKLLVIHPPYKKDNIETWCPAEEKNRLVLLKYLGGKTCCFSINLMINASETASIDIFNKASELIIQDTLQAQYYSIYFKYPKIRDNHLLLAGADYLLEYDLKAKKIIHKRRLNGDVLCTQFNHEGRIMYGMRDKGVFIADAGNTGEKELSLLKGSSVSSICEDNNKGLWMGTLNEGIYYRSNFGGQVLNVAPEKSKTILYLKNLKKGYILIAFEKGGGKLFLENKNKEIKLAADLSKIEQREGVDNLAGVHQISDDSLFLFYTGGSFLYKMGEDHFTRIRVERELDVKGANGFYKYGKEWVGLGFYGVNIMNPASFLIRKSTTSHYRNTCFAKNPDTKEAYLGTIQGLYRFTEQKEITEQDKMLNVRVKSLEWMNNKLFVSTKAYGILVKHEQGFDTINEAKGLLSDICDKMVIDENRCWVSTNKGISCIQYNSPHDYEIRNYPLKTFDLSSRIADFFVRGNRLYFASGARLYVYPVQAVEQKKEPFYIYSIQVGNKSYSPCKNRELSYKENEIRVFYGALYYWFNGKVNYRYKLVPGNEEWIYTNESNVLFPSLSPGSYNLKLQAQQFNGNWIECPVPCSFVIYPPYWQRTWFVLLVVLVLTLFFVGLFWWVYQRRVRKEIENNMVQLKLKNLEIKAMKAQMNPHFIFNSLNSIQHLILSNDTDNAHKYLSKFSKLVRRLLESNREEFLTINNELEILKNYLEIESLRLKESFTYEFKVQQGINKERRIPHMMIQPFIENSIWHGLFAMEGKRELLVQVKQLNEHALEWVIIDNGIGIKNSVRTLPNPLKEKSLAVDFIKERLKLFSDLKGQRYYLEITDRNDISPDTRGTLVRIIIPVIEE